MYSPWFTNSLIPCDYKSGRWDGENSREPDARTWNKTGNVRTTKYRGAFA